MFCVRFVVRHRWGHEERCEDPEVIKPLLTKLDSEDPEHTDVSVRLEDGWTISASSGGILVFENVESDDAGGPRHLRGVVSTPVENCALLPVEKCAV
jgi:hypothetical protein